MRRNKTKPDTAAPASVPAPESPGQLAAPAARPAPARVLIAVADADHRKGLARMLRDGSLVCDPVGSITEAVGAMTAVDYDAAVIDMNLPDGAGLDLVRRLGLERRHTKAIICSSGPTLDDAVSAMRVGAVDFVALPAAQAEIIASVVTAVDIGRAERDQDRRVERLKRICRRLNAARQQVTSQVDVLCNDLVGAYRELADQVSQVTLASEFTSIIQQELDIESLLRSALEYMLTKTGPTNAAVFLPSSHSDFSLGAYVNYDCPRDTADVLLDHLSDVIAPRFQDETEIIQFEDEGELAQWIGDDANWLADSKVIVFSCRHDGECLAVITLFRDRATPFTEELIPQLKVMADRFAEQLARIIRVHHRLSPGKEWSGFDAWEDDEDGGIAA